MRLPTTVVCLLAIIMLGPATIARAGGPAYRGVHVHGLLDDDPGRMKRELGAARRLGANTVRVDVLWAAYEARGPGRYDPDYQARVDRFMRGLGARRMKAIAMIHQSPCWAPTGSTSACLLPPLSSNRAPRDARDYGRFVRHFARRYRRRLAAIEVWNEPNNGFFFQARDRKLAYAGLVKAAYPQVKVVAPRVKVLAGALSGADADFLSGLYQHGIRGNYDAISIHPYQGDGSTPPDLSVPEGQERLAFLSGLKLIRRTQRAARDRAPVWATEFGWHTGAYRNMTATPWMNGVSAATQAGYLERALTLLRRRSSGLGFVQGAIVYSLRDNDAGPLVLGNFGLLSYRFGRKPSFASVTRAFAAIRRSRQHDRLRELRRRVR